MKVLIIYRLSSVLVKNLALLHVEKTDLVLQLLFDLQNSFQPVSERYFFGKQWQYFFQMSRHRLFVTEPNDDMETPVRSMKERFRVFRLAQRHQSSQHLYMLLIIVYQLKVELDVAGNRQHVGRH